MTDDAQRLAKKAERQREYRQRLKQSRRPSRNDIAATLLHFTVQRTAHNGEWKLFNGVMDEVTSRLVDRGFDRTETEQAIDALVERIENGWEFQRKRELEDDTY